MKIIILGVPHMETLKYQKPDNKNDKTYYCPFTKQTWLLSYMLNKKKHEILHIGSGKTDSGCKHISTITKKELDKVKKNDKNDNQIWGINTRKHIDEYLKKDRDWSVIITCSYGGGQQIATKNLNQYVVETGVGYRWTWSQFRVFHCYAWMHMIWGKEDRFTGNRWMDTVIPPLIDFSDFQYCEKPEDYFLFFGRTNIDKGIDIAIDIANLTKTKLIISGVDQSGYIIKKSKYIKIIRNPSDEQRKILLKNAKALICPTKYVEPYGQNAIEALLSGTPVITTDWGGYCETIQQGINGFKCHTMGEFISAAKNIHIIKRKVCKEEARKIYNPNRIINMYEDYFYRLLRTGIKGQGWGSLDKSDIHLPAGII